MSSNSSTGSGSTSNTNDCAILAEALKEAIEIKDRKWRTKTYHHCFLHSEAVRWVQEHRHTDEIGAVSLLNELHQAGYVQHSVDPHKPFKVGQTKKLYFCFVDDDKSHINQQQKRSTNKTKAKILKNNKLTEEMLKDLFENSDEITALQTKLNRVTSSLSQLTQTHMATQTKLEIVHQCVISMIQALIATALLLSVLLFYTLVVVVPALNDYQATGMALVTLVIGTLLLCAFGFVVKGSRLVSVWLTLDNCVVQATEGEDAVEDYEMDKTPESSSAPAMPPRRGLGSRKQSSIQLQEPMLRSASQSLMQKMMSFKNHNEGNIQADAKKIQQRQASDIPDPSLWPHRPVMVCVNTPVSRNLKVEPAYGTGPCPIGKPFSFSSELFEGQCLIRLKDVPNSDNPTGDEAYFSGRRRLFQTVIQGRFKEPLAVSDVLTGHEFVKPLENLPHPWILKAATNLIGKLAPGAVIEVAGNNPTMLAGMAATSQVVRGDEPGNEPDIASTTEGDIQEDCSLFGGKFSGGNVSARGRKLHLAHPSRAAQYSFDTETVYTFDFYQSLLNTTTYALDLGVAHIGMAPILNGQPIQCLCKTTDGRYLWSFQLWHESLLPSSNEDESSSAKKMKSQ